VAGWCNRLAEVWPWPPLSSSFTEAVTTITVRELSGAILCKCSSSYAVHVSNWNSRVPDAGTEDCLLLNNVECEDYQVQRCLFKFYVFVVCLSDDFVSKPGYRALNWWTLMSNGLECNMDEDYCSPLYGTVLSFDWRNCLTQQPNSMIFGVAGKIRTAHIPTYRLSRRSRSKGNVTSSIHTKVMRLKLHTQSWDGWIPEY
jgi:hypothetical protein